MIHHSSVNKLLHEYELMGNEFDIECRSKSDGRLVKGRVICTSSNFERKTANIKFINSNQTRTIRTILITSINNTPVYL